MKKALRIFGIILTFILFLSISGYSEGNTIRLGYSDAEAFPYQINHQKNPPGIAFEIITAAAQRAGIKIKYVKLPNKRVQYSLKSGKIIDGAFMFSYNKSRLENGVYPLRNGKADHNRRIATLGYYIYKMKNSPVQWNGRKFSGLKKSDRVGANSGYSVVKDLEKKGVNVDDGAKTTEQNFRKLLSGRIAAYAHQSLVAENYIKKNNLVNIEKIKVPFKEKDYFLMFSHQMYNSRKDLCEKLWNEIGRIRDSKTSEVVSKY